jgi:hypothetical protein
MDVPDDEGKDLPDFDAAMAHARKLARLEVSEMVKEEGRVVLHHRIEIEDEQRAVLGTVHFRDVVEVETSPRS